MHTKLQSKVLKELYNLTPEASQLWISTHSIGMLKQAEEIETANPNTVVFLDFGNRDFDLDEVMTPAKIDKAIWDRFFDLAFADFSALIAPKKIVFCEGTSQGRKYKDFDALPSITDIIFWPNRHDTRWYEAGASRLAADYFDEEFGSGAPGFMAGSPNFYLIVILTKIGEVL